MKNEIMALFNKMDSATYNHSVRVMDIAIEIERYLKLSNNNLSNAALLHDVGKIYVPMKILDKKGRLDPLERELVDLHPYIGYCLLKDCDVDEDICRIVLYHHGFNPYTIHHIDNYDKLDVLEQSAMLHSIDAFEALTTDRSYHRGLPAKEALKIMQGENNHHERVLEYIQLTIENDVRQESAINRGSYIPNENPVIYLMEHTGQKKIAL